MIEMQKKKQNNKKVPNLRFAFEGELQMKLLEEITKNISSGKSKNKTEYGEYPFYGSTGLIAYSNTADYFGNRILIARVGANAGSLYKVNGKYSVSDNTLMLDLNNEVNIDFLYYYLIKTNLNQLIFGSGQPLITAGQLKSLKLFFPIILEQQKIGSFLSLIDERIATQNKIIAQLQTLMQGLSEQLFIQQVRFKDENGKNFPDWKEKKLGEVCEVNPKTSPLPQSFVYIDLESVVSGSLSKTSKMEKYDAPSRAQRILKKNDILFQMVRPYQKNNFYFDREGDYVASTGYAQLRTKQNSKFVYYYLHFQEFVDNVIERCTGTSYPAINSTDLSSILINIPVPLEQDSIANLLSSIDEKIKTEKKVLQQYERQKKYLLQNMFI